MDWWKSQALFYVSFPRLKHLDCRINRNDDNELLLWYLPNVACEVETLILPTLSLHNVSTLTHALGGRCRLKTLYLHLGSLTPLVLDWLANRLPNLQSLYVSFLQVSLQDDFDPEKGISEDSLLSAYQGFSSRVHSDWALESIWLEDRTPRLYHRPMVFKAAIVKALPNVKYFNQMTREVYLGAEDSL